MILVADIVSDQSIKFIGRPPLNINYFPFIISIRDEETNEVTWYSSRGQINYDSRNFFEWIRGFTFVNDHQYEITVYNATIGASLGMATTDNIFTDDIDSIQDFTDPDEIFLCYRGKLLCTDWQGDNLKYKDAPNHQTSHKTDNKYTIYE